MTLHLIYMYLFKLEINRKEDHTRIRFKLPLYLILLFSIGMAIPVVGVILYIGLLKWIISKVNYKIEKSRFEGNRWVYWDEYPLYYKKGLITKSVLKLIEILKKEI